MRGRLRCPMRILETAGIRQPRVRRGRLPPSTLRLIIAEKPGVSNRILFISFDHLDREVTNVSQVTEC